MHIQFDLKRVSIQYWGLFASLFVLFCMGGSARSDVYSLALLYPVLFLLSGAALCTLSLSQIRTHKAWFIGFGIIFILTVLHALPLTETLKLSSQGYLALENIRSEAGLTQTSSVMGASRNWPWAALSFLISPFLVFLYAIQLKRDDLGFTPQLAVFLGIASAALGLLQLVGGRNAPFYLYQITNEGSAVGLFANRNHAAIFLSCVFPILAVLATGKGTSRKSNGYPALFICASIAILLVILILITGSRVGVLMGFLAISSSFLIYYSMQNTVKIEKISNKYKIITFFSSVFVVVFLVLLSIYFSRALAVDRLFNAGNEASIRTNIWDAGYPLFWHYFPLGFGANSFTAVFQNIEPLDLLSATYVNRLHNDWLEFVVTYGVPGVFLLFLGTAYYFYRTYLLWMRMDCARSSVALGRVGSVIIGILAISSISDYPLRTPALAGFAALVLFWFTNARHDVVAH